ncbi:MAG: LysR family transcriptional regulator [Aliidongia sp.]
MDWEMLRTFNAAAETGSFSSAADALDVSQASVARHVTVLERNLQTSLFHRHTRGLKMTEQGELLHKAVREIIAQVSMAEARLAEHRSYPCGTLKISINAAFGAFWLAPRLKEFLERYPEITPLLLFDGGAADLSMREADVAIRLSPPQKSDVVQRRILSSRSFAYASPEYLRKHGMPYRPQDLDRHRLIVGNGSGRAGAADDNWLLRLGAAENAPRRPVATLDDLHGLYRAVQSGLGIGALPHFASPESTGLVRILPEAASPRVDGYFVYPAELRDSKRIAVFRDFLLYKIAEAGIHEDPFDRPGQVPHAESGPPLPISSISGTGRTSDEPPRSAPC